MKFIVSSSELYTYLQLLNKVVPSRAMVPLIENFLFEVSNNRLKITATDLETTLKANFELSLLEGEGSFAIDAKKFLEILKEFPDQPLTLQLNEENSSLLIKTETGKYTLPVYVNDLDNFPQPTPIDSATSNIFEISPYILHKAISSTAFAVGNDELRPITMGIYVEISPEYTTFVATDSHKLIRYRRYDVKGEKRSSFVLPLRPAELIKNILTKTTDNVLIEFNDRNAKFETTNFTVICRLIEGNYPDYERVIPTNNDKEVQIDRQTLINTIKRVSLFSNETSKLVKFTFNNTELEISAQDLDFSISAYENIPCLSNFENFVIGFKSVFINEILTNINSKDVVISFLNRKLPALILPSSKDEENEDLISLLVPANIDLPDEDEE